MYDTFQVAAGTIPGRQHVGVGNLLTGKNNQDAYGVANEGDCLVATVFDGCGSTRHPEVGAKLAAAIVPTTILNLAKQSQYRRAQIESLAFWRAAESRILERFKNIAVQMNGDHFDENIVSQYFLFTIVGVLITRDFGLAFSAGDGLFALNETMHRIGPFQNNAPPYLCYGLMNGYRGAHVELVVHAVTDAPIESALVASDGLIHLLGREHCKLPGRQYEVGPLSQLWSSECFFGDGVEESITPWLRRVNSEVVLLSEEAGGSQIRRYHGLLNDDTTMVAIRRRG